MITYYKLRRWWARLDLTPEQRAAYDAGYEAGVHLGRETRRILDATPIPDDPRDLD